MHTLDGHFSLLPVTIAQQVSTLRNTNTLPFTGKKSHSSAIASLASLAIALNVPPLTESFLSIALPPSLFHEDGSLRRHVQSVARTVTAHAVVCVVDKGPGQLWGFYEAWAWDALQTFLTVQGYSREAADPSFVFQDLQHAVQRHTWPSNSKARLALLYLIGKAKSSI